MDAEIVVLGQIEQFEERSWRDIVCDWAFEQGDSDDLLEALSKAGWCIVRQNDYLRQFAEH